MGHAQYFGGPANRRIWSEEAPQRSNGVGRGRTAAERVGGGRGDLASVRRESLGPKREPRPEESRTRETGEPQQVVRDKAPGAGKELLPSRGEPGSSDPAAGRGGPKR